MQYRSDPLMQNHSGVDTTVISRRAPMLIGPAIGDTDPIRRTSPSPGGQLVR
jgi:hypothetical protein